MNDYTARLDALDESAAEWERLDAEWMEPDPEPDEKWYSDDPNY